MQNNNQALASYFRKRTASHNNLFSIELGLFAITVFYHHDATYRTKS